ncbi:unnamed protein product [Phaeothamnion confervicola]
MSPLWSEARQSWNCRRLVGVVNLLLLLALLWLYLAQRWPYPQEKKQKQSKAIDIRAIKHIRVVGERHSGTTFITKLLEKMFVADPDIDVSARLCNWKHWFQTRIHEAVIIGNRRCNEIMPCAECVHPEQTLVIIVWRNPYDWVTSMFGQPHHAISHYGIAFHEFLRKSWTLDPAANNASAAIAAASSAAERERINAPRISTERRCIDNFISDQEVIPCLPSERRAIYELNESGEPFPNIYSLRLAKIADFAAIAKWAPHYEVIHYDETLLRGGATAVTRWLDKIADRVGAERSGARSRKILTTKTLSLLSSMSKSSIYLNGGCSKDRDRRRAAPTAPCLFQCDPRSLEALHTMWDEEAEASIGYHKMKSLALPAAPGCVPPRNVAAPEPIPPGWKPPPPGTRGPRRRWPKGQVKT